MKFEWKNSGIKYESGESLFVNGFVLGKFFWGAIHREDNLPYKIVTVLPCFLPKKKEFATIEEAKTALEGFTRRWFERFTKETS